MRNMMTGTDEKVDRITFNLRRRLNLFKPVYIVAYRSYGTPTRLYLKGRVLANKNINSPEDHHTTWHNLVNMYKRFYTDEIPNAVLGVHYQDQHYTITSDEEGYFVLNLAPEIPLDLGDIWHHVEIELLESPVRFREGEKATAEVLVPPPGR